MHEELTLAIDPSVNNLGWAIFKGQELTFHGTVFGDDVKKLSHEKRTEYIIDSLLIATQTVGMHLVLAYIIIEKPKLWGSVKSMASQASGDLLGLHLLSGSLYWWGRGHCYKGAVYIPVADWKGQLKKTTTQKRLTRRYGKVWETHDEADAIGVGDYFVREVLDDEGNIR